MGNILSEISIFFSVTHNVLELIEQTLKESLRNELQQWGGGGWSVISLKTHGTSVIYSCLYMQLRLLFFNY